MTTPAIATLRARISQAMDETAEATVLEHLKVWLQMPTDSLVTSMLDRDCDERAKKVGDRLSSDPRGHYNPADLSAAADIAVKWEGIGKILHGDRAVILKGPPGHVGGDKSVFLAKNGIGFHVIVLLATGQEPGGSPFFLGLDPDVSATRESRMAWAPVALGGKGTVAKVSVFNDAKCTEVIKKMILGASQDGFGPLVRKYYVDTTEAFPAVVHA
ncbi:hypothetical protein OHT52_18290 [Streptomyces sp. NBC_00247]|uniref:hypothetical protein n=1 Tax=Streptomyces sp. NBC_00247 TaxID=2975689 RepID=UPI002E2B542B|nr:hypothetical protein [Streptomyces sp. NBC_00247]